MVDRDERSKLGAPDWFPDVLSEEEQRYRNLVHVGRPLVNGMAIHLASDEAQAQYKEGEMNYLQELISEAYRRMEKYPPLW